MKSIREFKVTKGRISSEPECREREKKGIRDHPAEIRTGRGSSFLINKEDVVLSETWSLLEGSVR